MAASGSSCLRRQVYRLLIALAAASMIGRTLAVNQATLSANDRSRWATVRALVDDGTYAIGQRIQDPSTATYRDQGIVADPSWDTVDKVLHPETLTFYSSKPPLLATLLAGEYWLLKRVLGWSITEDRWPVLRTMLITVNCLPLTLYLVLLAGLVERLGLSDWGRIYVVASACFGTFLTTFAVVLNNHTVAACCALYALAAALHIRADPQRLEPGFPERWRSNLRFALAGFFAGSAACMDLPAAAFAAALGVVLLTWAPGRTLLLFLPAAAVPVAAFLITNYLAVGQLRPVYAEFGGPWYTYEGSYWKPGSRMAGSGIDAAGTVDTKLEYALHLLDGHHGLFSLSPIFLLALATVVCGRCGGTSSRGDPVQLEKIDAGPVRQQERRLVAILTAILTVIVIGFYVVQTSNYGGYTAGPRWLFWLTPLLLLTMLPAADWSASRRWGRVLGYVLLGLSVLSASYPMRTPWSHPWLYDLMECLRWIQY